MDVGSLLLEAGDANALLEEIEKNPGVIRAYFEGLMPSVVSFLLQIAVTIVILLIGSRMIKWIVKFVRKSLDKSRAETGVITFLCSLIRYSLYFVLLMIVLSQFGVTTSSVVAVLGSAGLTLGLALQGSLSNFAGGVLILLLKPFVVGDYIIEDTNKDEGTVKEIQTFYTKLTTVDNKTIVIPNGILANNSLTNVTAKAERQLDLRIGISYDSELKKAKLLLEQMLKEIPSIMQDENLYVFVDSLGESSVVLGIRGWVKTDEYWTTRWDLLERIKLTFDEEGIVIPYNQLTVHLDEKAGSGSHA